MDTKKCAYVEENQKLKVVAVDILTICNGLQYIVIRN